jgi:hypothetical protein
VLNAAQSTLSGSKKRRTSTNGLDVALNGIKESLDTFNTILERKLGGGTDRDRADTSPERRSKAMDLLQEKETYLDDNRIVALVDLFQTDTGAADAYLALKRDNLHKLWIERQLTKDLGFPAISMSDDLYV